MLNFIEKLEWYEKLKFNVTDAATLEKRKEYVNAFAFDKQLMLELVRLTPKITSHPIFDIARLVDNAKRDMSEDDYKSWLRKVNVNRAQEKNLLVVARTIRILFDDHKRFAPGLRGAGSIRRYDECRERYDEYRDREQRDATTAARCELVRSLYELNTIDVDDQIFLMMINPQIRAIDDLMSSFFSQLDDPINDHTDDDERIEIEASSAEDALGKQLN